MARAGKHVGYLNLEMLVDRFSLRALSAESGVGYRKLRGQQGKTRDDLTLMTSAASSLQNLPLVFWGQDAIDISDFAAECRMRKARGQLDAVFVDYAQLLRHRGMGHGASREQYVASIVHALKSMAMRLAIPVFALAQLNRQNDARLDKRPTLSDLRETSAFEHDASCIMLLHSPIKYAKDEKEKAAMKGKLEVCLAKNRDGPTGQVDVHLDHDTMAITQQWIPPGERVEF
jgi:replicative DNA helicase